ncbi:hypothetical protein K439DRAFT_912189 [Ramaria rubella]|nr:hypothetical protein K439DRAFT_912189 [Ramaria rubella]
MNDQISSVSEVLKCLEDKVSRFCATPVNASRASITDGRLSFKDVRCRLHAYQHLNRTLTRNTQLVSESQNELLPIHRLSDDVLACMFEVVSSSSDPTASLFLSHVCRRWRRIARKNSLLWTTIDSVRPSLIPTYLQLSKEAPICFIIDSRSLQSLPSSTGLLMGHSHRLIRLEIRTEFYRIQQLDSLIQF